MGSVKSITEDAFEMLRDDIYTHLDDAELPAVEVRPWSEKDDKTVRTLIIDLIGVIRGLLVSHKVRGSGTCKFCAVARPCPTVSTIHGLVKDPDNVFLELIRKANEED